MVKKVVIIVSVALMLAYIIKPFVGKSGACHTVLSYSDFGSGVGDLQRDLIGRDLWRWLNYTEDPLVEFDIKVVLYAPAEKLTDLKQQYPIDQEKEQDYRYVSISDLECFLSRELIDKKEPLESCQKDPHSSCRQFDYIEGLKNSVHMLKNNNCMAVGDKAKL